MAIVTMAKGWSTAVNVCSIRVTEPKQWWPVVVVRELPLSRCLASSSDTFSPSDESIDRSVDVLVRNHLQQVTCVAYTSLFVGCKP